MNGQENTLTFAACSGAMEYTFFPPALWTSSKTDHILIHKINFSKYKRETAINSWILSDHSGNDKSITRETRKRYSNTEIDTTQHISSNDWLPLKKSKRKFKEWSIDSINLNQNINGIFNPTKKKSTYKSIWKCNFPKHPKQSSKERTELGVSQCQFQIIPHSYIYELIWSWHKNRKVGEWNRL